jgi:hypothetical protein
MKGVHVEPANVIKEIRLDILNLEKSQSDKVKIIKSGMLPNFFLLYNFACTYSGQLHVFSCDNYLR